MQCSCDGEEAIAQWVRIRTARHHHYCCECDGSINETEKYEHTTLLGDCFSHYKTCLDCVNLREYVQERIPCFCFRYGDMIEDAIEQIKSRLSFKTPGLMFGAYRLIAKIRKRCHGF
jgi:hypothetical protein